MNSDAGTRTRNTDTIPDSAPSEPPALREVLWLGQLATDSVEILRLPLESLRLDGSPRIEGEDEAHIQVLAEVETPMPPVVVHRATMRVIDGVHRVRAARLKGETTVSAVFFDGDSAAAFVHGVRANVSHGLPLSLTDRRAAAKRILGCYPEWSDGVVAAVTGLAVTTIGSIRSTVGGSPSQVAGRIGRDGRVRPLDPAPGRLRAAEVLAARPDASLRDIASSAGVSIGTARDVRKRIIEGRDPVPARGRHAVPDARSGRNVSERRGLASRDGDSVRRRDTPRAPSSILEELRKDPSLRYSARGRGTIRWLDGHIMDAGERQQITHSIPPHCAYKIAEFAIGCANEWRGLAEELLAYAESL